MNKKIFIVEQKEKVTKFLSKCGFPYPILQKCLRNKDVKVNGVKIKEDADVFPGDEIEIFYTNLPLKYQQIYEDENILVVNKFAGVETDGDNGLKQAIGGVFAVHRLDRNTCGLVVFAKTTKAKLALEEAFKNHNVTKMYIAEVVGKANFDGRIYTAYLQKDSEKSYVKIFDSKQKNSVQIKTKLKTLKKGETSIVQIQLLTGKTHQIRAHLAHLGYAIVGDGKYGKNEDNKKFKAKNQRLFCYSVTFFNLKGDMQYLNGKEFKTIPKIAENAKITL